MLTFCCHEKLAFCATKWSQNIHFLPTNHYFEVTIIFFILLLCPVMSVFSFIFQNKSASDCWMEITIAWCHSLGSASPCSLTEVQTFEYSSPRQNFPVFWSAPPLSSALPSLPAGAPWSGDAAVRALSLRIHARRRHAVSADIRRSPHTRTPHF